MEAVHPVSVITGSDGEERRDEGRRVTAGCGRLIRTGLRGPGSGKPGSWGGYITSRPNPVLPPFAPYLAFLF